MTAGPGAPPGRAGGRGRGARAPLRVQLVAALLALAALGLLVTGVAGNAALRHYLLERVDTQLADTTRATLAQLERRGGWSPEDRRGGPLGPTTTFYLRWVPSGGSDVVEYNQGGERPPALAALGPDGAGAAPGTPFTVPARGGGGAWRAVVVPIADTAGTLTVALTLRDLEATVAELTRVQVVVGLLVLAVLAVLAHAVVRRSLRPLVEVERTAQAIAAGDLTRRVPDRDPRTEVGRLARALNGMLAQIEAAFSARAASETAARQSEERMRRFVADASHELRTPLTSIRGFAELHRQGAAPAPEDTERIMGRIESEAKRMGVLVEDLLLLARLDQQRPLERGPVDLLALASDAVHDARALAPDRVVELRLGGQRAPIVAGDEARLRQVLGNLLANALRHTPAGTPVTVALGTDDAGGAPVAVLEVSDAGPGLAPEHARRVFERFYRADASRSRAQGGTGLGLSIVAALVAAHGGAVDVDTAPRRGATFRVRLPLAADPAGHPAGVGSPGARAAVPGGVALP